MQIDVLALSNFRGFEETILKLSPGYNVIKGPNRAGKTTLLYAISWCLRGACSKLTDARGANWTHLRRRLPSCEDPVDTKIGVAVMVSGVGQIERARGPKMHRMVVPGSPETDSTYNATVLRNGVLKRMAKETAAFLLDPEPFILRQTADQNLALTTLLRPEQIKVPASVKPYGIDEILGAADLRDHIKRFKEVVLRDANRAVTNLQKQAVKRPEWPAPGRTAEQLKEGYQKLTGHRDTLQHNIGQREGAITAVRKRLATVDDEQYQVLSKEDIASVKDRLKRRTDKRTGINARLSEIATELELLDGKRVSAGEEKQRYAQAGAKAEATLETLRDPVVCPQTDCPVISNHNEAIADKKAGAEELQKAASAAFAKFATQHDDFVAAMKTLQSERGELDTGSKVADLNLTILDLTDNLRLHESETKRKELAVPRATLDAELTSLEKEKAELERQLQTTRMQITKADTMTQRVADFNADILRADRITTDLQTASAEQMRARRAVKSLETLQEKLVGEKIEQFLHELNSFMQHFNIPLVEHSWSKGFLVDGQPLFQLLSDGQTQMLFDAAIRVAAAKITGLDMVLLDHKAPLDKYHHAAMVTALRASGMQIIQTFTSDVKAPIMQPETKSFWVNPPSLDGSEPATVEELPHNQ